MDYKNSNFIIIYNNIIYYNNYLVRHALLRT